MEHTIGFEYTGSPVEFIIPEGIYQIRLEAYGGSGGQFMDASGTLLGKPGYGAGVKGLFRVQPGDILWIKVEAAGKSSRTAGGGGGGGAFVKRIRGNSAEWLLVAGGGGGAGATAAEQVASGGMGGWIGKDGGSTGTTAGGGKGALLSAPGMGGQGSYANGGNGTQMGGDGTDVDGQGGKGASGSNLGGGGGGDGFTGGGGGAAGNNEVGGGGGGSSYNVGSRRVFIDGANMGNGYVVIVYDDERDNEFSSPPFIDKAGKSYKTIEINGQLWMAENLSFPVENGTLPSSTDPAEAKIWGLYYSFDAAVAACPDGWRIPNYTDWDILIKSYGGWLDVMWSQPGVHQTLMAGGASGMDILYSGIGNYGYEGVVGQIWGTPDPKSSETLPYYYNFSTQHGKIYRNICGGDCGWNSVRYVKDLD